MSDDLNKTDLKDPRFSKIQLESVSTDNQEPISQILTALKKDRDLKVIQMSFDLDPSKTGSSQYIYRNKQNLVPNDILKRIRDTEELIGGIILPVRSRQTSLFARPRANRFDVGFTIDFKPDVYSKIDDAKRESLKLEIIPKLKEILLNCGLTSGVIDRKKRTLSQFMHEITEDLLTFGQCAIEFRENEAGQFHSFRAVDAGTIYHTLEQKETSKEAEFVRKKTKAILEKLQGVNIDMDRFHNDDYTYVQVISGEIKQVFTDREMCTWTTTPTTDVSRDGYPLSPIERILSAVTTHINLTTHNKMYFLNGRAARNILVFQAENMEPQDLAAIRAQMQGHINSSNAAWRTPVFGMGVNDKVQVVPLDGSGRDMEFQYLADLNKRIIMAAYQISPDEIAALSYLSRGTNSQSLSESNNEYKLIAARDGGLRPILLSIEDLFNERILPKINKEWAKIFRIDFAGLDADSPEKESTRLQQDQQLYLTMNDIMDKVEKEPVPIGGDLPLNAVYLQVLEKYFTKGQILKAFGGKGFEQADQDPGMAYCLGDQISTQLFMMQAQMKMQAQMQPPGGQPQSDGVDPSGQGSSGIQGDSQQDPSGGQDLESASSQLEQSLTKSEKDLPITRKELLKKHRQAKRKIVESFEQESKTAIDKIIKAITGEDDGHGH